MFVSFRTVKILSYFLFKPAHAWVLLLPWPSQEVACNMTDELRGTRY